MFQGFDRLALAFGESSNIYYVLCLRNGFGESRNTFVTNYKASHGNEKK